MQSTSKFSTHGVSERGIPVGESASKPRHAQESRALHWTTVQDLQLSLVVEIGRVRLSLGELTQLKAGDVLALDSMAYQPVNLLVQGRVVARGEIVIVGERHGICLTDILCD